MSFFRKSDLNSNIYRDPDTDHLIDMSALGVRLKIEQELVVKQEVHGFDVGDALYYNINEELFRKAIAFNTMQCEVCGIVSKVIDKDNFKITSQGLITTSRYNYPINTILFLADTKEGWLSSTAPTGIIKQVAIQTDTGIEVSIERGYKVHDVQEHVTTLDSYTTSELDNIILDINNLCW